MSGISVSIRMFPDFFQALFNMQTKAQKGLEVGMYQEAETEMTMSKQLTPVDTGTLRASGRVEEPNWFGKDTIVIKLAYGGPAIDYALRVHEDLNVYHRVGRAKFLESVVREEAGTGRAGQRIANVMREYLQS